jgi:hypothetical protein
MINSTEIRKIVTNELDNYLAPLGYCRNKVKGEIVASFEKNDGNYFYDFYSHTNKYNEYQLVYGFSFGINRIVNILKEINLHVPLIRPKSEIKSSITGISPGQLLDPLRPARAYKYFTTENELLSILDEVKFFYAKTFVPFYEKYSKFTELDKLINSPDNFWIDTTGKTIPISFFHVTRLIIARLLIILTSMRWLRRISKLWKNYGKSLVRYMTEMTYQNQRYLPQSI